MVLHSSSINIMLVKSKNCFVDLSLTSTRFLAPNFLITAEHESPPQKTQLETRKCNYSRMKVSGSSMRQDRNGSPKKNCISCYAIVFGDTRWSFDFDYISPGHCVWNSSLNHSGSSPNPLKAACWSHFLLWLDLIWGYKLFQRLTKSRQISSD